MDTVVNVGVGGAANAGLDYAFANIDFLGSVAAYKNVIKIAGGAIMGSMVKNKYLRAAADGIATVGVSSIVASYLPGAEESGATVAAGLPQGTIANVGRIRLGQRGFRRGRVAGLAGADFMAE